MRNSRTTRAAVTTGAMGWFAFAFAMPSCSSNKETTATATASTPGGAADGGSDAATGPDGSVPSDASGVVGGDDSGVVVETACTEPPFVTFTATLTTLDVNGSTKAPSGGTVGFSTCPGFKLVPDASGKVSTQITQNVPISPIYYAGASVLATIGAEIPATGDVTLTPTLFGVDVAPAIPGYFGDGGANQPTIVISLAATGTAPCNSISGVTFAATGHPEAVVSYASATWPVDPSVTTTPSGASYAFVSGLPSGAKVAITGAKTGCTVQIAGAAQTGSFLLVANAVSVGVATVEN